MTRQDLVRWHEGVPKIILETLDFIIYINWKDEIPRKVLLFTQVLAYFLGNKTDNLMNDYLFLERWIKESVKEGKV